jgi:hypothetical protein
MGLVNAPGTLRLARVAQDGATYALSGDLGPSPDAFRSARVDLTDAKGTTVSYPVPMTVAAAPERPGPGAPVLTSQDFSASFARGSLTYADASVAGGTPPFSWSIGNGPAAMTVGGQANVPNGSQVRVYASIATPGPYQGVTLTVTDAAGKTASRTYAPFEIRTDAGNPALSVSAMDQVPATVPPGTTWTSGPFTVSGGSGAGYNGYVQGGPNSQSFALVPVGTDGRTFRIELSPTTADIGRYPGLAVIMRDGEGSPDTVVGLGTTAVPSAAPIVAVSQPDKDYREPVGTYNPIVNGTFSGGTGPYSVEVFGLPADGTIYLFAYAQAAASGNGVQEILTAAYGSEPRTYEDLLMVVTDTRTGERIPFDRFRLTIGPGSAAAGGPITACSGWGVPDGYRLNVGDTMDIYDGLSVTGGVAPFRVEYDASAIQPSLGFEILPGNLYPNALAQGRTGIEVRMKPTAPGAFSNVPARIVDSNDSSCAVSMSSTVSPHGTPRS